MKAAKKYLDDAKEEKDQGVRDWHVRHAFDGLFDAARIASMTYLATENTRWGRVRKKLPSDLKMRFDQLIERLHIDYFYLGNYQREYEKEFDNWYRSIEEYVKRLESELKR